MDDQTSDRKMYQGNWSCSSCGSPITELPFEPRSTSNLMCRECHGKGKSSQAPRQAFKGDWKCNTCNASITELPFEPRDTGNLMCRDCFKKSKGFT